MLTVIFAVNLGSWLDEDDASLTHSWHANRNHDFLTFHKVVLRHTWGVVGSLVIMLLQIFSWSRQWKNFENRLIFNKVKVFNTNCAIFLAHPVVCVGCRVYSFEWCTCSYTGNSELACLISQCDAFVLSLVMEVGSSSIIGITYYFHQQPSGELAFTINKESHMLGGSLFYCKLCGCWNWNYWKSTQWIFPVLLHSAPEAD